MNRANFGRILVAYDGSESALRACESAAIIAKKFESNIRLVYVIPTLSLWTAPLADAYYAVQKEAAEAAIQKCLKIFDLIGVAAKSDVVQGRWSIVETIVNYALDEQIDLIVMGAKGQGGFEKMLVGSVSGGVVAHAPCPVLIIR